MDDLSSGFANSKVAHEAILNRVPDTAYRVAKWRPKKFIQDFFFPPHPKVRLLFPLSTLVEEVGRKKPSCKNLTIRWILPIIPIELDAGLCAHPP
jgi:hypothetical protein